MKVFITSIALVLITVLTSSCATMFTGTTDSVSFVSTPPGASVYLNGGYQGTTPLNLSLQRDKDYNVVVKKDGYQESSANISRSFNAVSILNLASPICWIVDIVTGALWKFDKDSISVELKPSSGK